MPQYILLFKLWGRVKLDSTGCETVALWICSSSTSDNEQINCQILVNQLKKALVSQMNCGITKCQESQSVFLTSINVWDGFVM